jgi:hypothetical protein
MESMYFGDFANRLQGGIKNIIHYYDFCSDRDIMQKWLLHRDCTSANCEIREVWIRISVIIEVKK